MSSPRGPRISHLVPPGESSQDTHVTRTRRRPCFLRLLPFLLFMPLIPLFRISPGGVWAAKSLTAFHSTTEFHFTLWMCAREMCAVLAKITRIPVKSLTYLTYLTSTSSAREAMCRKITWDLPGAINSITARHALKLRMGSLTYVNLIAVQVVCTFLYVSFVHRKKNRVRRIGSQGYANFVA